MVTDDLEPSPTRRWTLRFTLLGVRVRIDPGFWLIAGALGLRLPYLEWALWIGVVLVVVLFHEAAHVVALRSMGVGSRVVVSVLGGRTVPDLSPELSSWRRVAVGLAGPLASFLLAGSCAILLPLFVSTASGPAGAVYYHLVRASATWGVVNLLPIGSFDGSDMLRTLFLRVRGTDGEAWMSLVSLVSSVAMVIVTWRAGIPVGSAFFAYCAFAEWQQSFD
jgi:Zn-dependent protease